MKKINATMFNTDATSTADSNIRSNRVIFRYSKTVNYKW